MTTQQVSVDHPSRGTLRAYAGTELAGARLESVDHHVAECRECIVTLAELTDTAELARGWARLDRSLDEPRPGRFERLLRLLGLHEDLARIAATTPALHASWLGTAAFIMVGALLITRYAPADVAGLAFLTTFPVLPVVGAALSFGPSLDPTYELTLVSPIGRFPIILLRTLSVLITLIGIAGLGSLAMPQQGLAAVAWMAPSLALTLVTIALTVKLEPRVAGACTAAAWAVCVIATSNSDGTSVLLTVEGQLAVAGLVVVAGAAVVRLRRYFDLLTPIDFPSLARATP
ncbi:hypothetical protein [Rhizomonospora bruguierae]|uniref:hypothetical protein n=1 Tax=Rhizomonospora bruguierae TaxID=1581705 RepID=UPI001BCEF55A|nr:hypothetical protein [Micromonospora sp. NBRC 107566]